MTEQIPNKLSNVKKRSHDKAQDVQSRQMVALALPSRSQ